MIGRNAAPKHAWLAGLCLTTGLLVRLPFITTDYRTTADVGLLRGWARTLEERGLTRAYDGTDINYPPVSLYWLRGAGWLEARLADRLPDTAREGLLNALVKLPAVLADGLTAALFLFVPGAGAGGRRVLAAAVYLFNPAIWYVSAHWGQIDAVYALFMAAGVLALLRGRVGWAWLAGALALATKLQSLSFVPLLAFVTWRDYGWRGLLRGWLVWAAAFGALAVPWLWAGEGRRLADAILPRAAPQVSVSAYNLWYLVLGGQVHGVSSLLGPLGLPFTFRLIGIALYAAFILAALACLWQRGGGPALPAVLLALGLFMLLTDIHERFMFPAPALLLLAALDGRVLTPRRVALGAAYLVLSLTFAFNLVTVAPFSPGLGTNLVAAQDGATLLKTLALACAAVNLVVLLGLTVMQARTPVEAAA